MTMRTVAMVAGAVAIAGTASVAAAQQPTQTITSKHRLSGSFYGQTKPAEQKPEPKPAEKTDAKPDKPMTGASLAGKWVVSLTTANGPLESALEMKADPKDAKKVAGTITSQMGSAPLEGEVVDGKLTIWFTMSANGSDIPVTITGTQQKDGTLAGLLSFGQGDIPWTAAREKK